MMKLTWMERQTEPTPLPCDVLLCLGAVPGRTLAQGARQVLQSRELLAAAGAYLGHLTWQ